jgi:predicted small lipoprotein YifL
MKKFVLFAVLAVFFGLSLTSCGSKAEVPVDAVVEEEVIEVDQDQDKTAASEKAEAPAAKETK